MHNTHDARFEAIETWLRTLLNIPFSLSPITGDASFRRYFRLSLDQAIPMLSGQSHAIVMDAPPPKESIEPFHSLGKQLFNASIDVPQIYASDKQQGFLLLEDFGNTQMLKKLNDESSDTLYNRALASLVQMQKNATEINVPAYDDDLLMREMNLFTDWLLGKHLGIRLTEHESSEINACFEQLSSSALQQPQTFVHRDYHSRNLMIKHDEGIGIIDFQDAVHGPITYDAVSLLRDCYITWPENKVDAWVNTYYQSLVKNGVVDVSFSEFKQWFDLMGIQRHLKASGIFARLYHRDSKTGYLADIPNTVRYIQTISPRYKHTQCLADIINKYDIINASKKAIQ